MLDIGCGLGDFGKYLNTHKFQNINYMGIDVVPEMIKAAKQKYPDYTLINENFMSETFQNHYDYLVCSGGLNIVVKPTHEEHLEYIKAFIKKMYTLANKGIAFNMLSIHCRDYFSDDQRFFYVDPDEILTFCKKISPNSEIDHSYMDYDFTVFMRKS